MEPGAQSQFPKKFRRLPLDVADVSSIDIADLLCVWFLFMHWLHLMIRTHHLMLPRDPALRAPQVRRERTGNKHSACV